MNKNYEAIKDIPILIHVELGRKKLTIEQLLKTNHGSIIELDKESNKPLNFFVNNKLWGTCEIVKMSSGKLGIKIVELLSKK